MQSAERRMAGAVGLLLLTLAACLPVIPHPTRVESAMHLAMNVGMSIMSDSSSTKGRTVGGIPVIDADLSLGLRDATRDDGPGVRLGVTGGMSGMAGSIYVELPRPTLGELDAGIGVYAHSGIFSNLGSYVQVGRAFATNADWFVRNAVVLSKNRGETYPVWMPTVGLSGTRGTRTMTLYLSGVVGQQPPTCSTIGCYEESYIPQTFMVIGASMAMKAISPRYGELPPRR